MGWFKLKFKSSMAGLLGRSTGPAESVVDGGIEDIREAMLSTLGADGSTQFSQLTRRIRYAADIKDLWYLRGDLMAALSAKHGEAVAREQVAAITDQFQGLLPGGLSSRPSPLA